MPGNKKRGSRYNFWPDADGLLIIPPAMLIVSKASRLMRSRTIPRIAKNVLLGSEWVHIQNSKIRMRNTGAVGFGPLIEIIFLTWLTAALIEAEFNAVRITTIVSSAELELGLTGELIRRLLIKHTGTRSAFRSDGEIVTLRDV